MVIRIKKDGTKQSAPVADDLVLPFRLEKSGVRGRVVRTGPVLAEIMSRHDYPAPVASLLSEVVTLAILLSAMLKYEGVFTLQAQGNGPVRLLVADVTSKGEVRAHAGFDPGAVKASARRRKGEDPYHLLGKRGRMSFTADPALDFAQRYQGIVEMKGASLAEAVQHYFTQSEQIKTALKLAVHPQDGLWRTGAVMIQQLPEEGGAGSSPIGNWTEAVMQLDDVADSDLVSPVLSAPDLLRRLFAEDGVRVYTPKHVHFKCRCTRARVLEVLRTIPRKELEALCKKDGKVSITCEFCSEKYEFSAQHMDMIYEENKK